MQLRKGTVTVTQNSTIVRGVYVATLTGIVGSAFSIGEDLVWGVDGVGLVTHNDTVASKLYFTRVSGELPIVSTVVRNPGNSKRGTVSGFSSDSVPDFVSELSGAGGPKIFAVQETGIFYNVLSQVTDQFTLAGVYGGVTMVEALYFIVRDFDPYFNWPMPAPSTIDLASLMSRTVAQIASTLYGVAKITPMVEANWTGSTSYYKDADRRVHLSGIAVNIIGSAPLLLFTLPAGYRPFTTLRFPIIVTSATIGVLEVATSGEVTVISGALNVAVYLDSVSFRGEA